MRNFFLPAFILFVVFSQAQTTLSKSFTHQGLLREYRVYIPAVYDGTSSVPLVFNLHGYTSNNIQQEAYGDFRPIADTANFILVHPNGTFDQYGYRYWNAFSYPSPSPDDLDFLSALIDTLVANYNIDQERVYSGGMSNGGFMSYDLACYLPNKITAVASVTGSMIHPHLNSCNPGRPVPVIQIHGTADATVPYNGTSSFTHIDTLVKSWVAKNNCNITPTVVAVPNTNTADNSTADHFIYSSGTGGASVELFKVYGGGHSWPGASVNVNTTNMDFKASVEIWRFWSQFRMSELTKVEAVQQSEITCWPNPVKDYLNIIIPVNFKLFRLQDATGRIFEIKAEGSKIEMFSLPSGVYFLTLVSEEKSSIVKVVKLKS